MYEPRAVSRSLRTSAHRLPPAVCECVQSLMLSEACWARVDVCAVLRRCGSTTSRGCSESRAAFEDGSSLRPDVALWGFETTATRFAHQSASPQRNPVFFEQKTERCRRFGRFRAQAARRP